VATKPILGRDVYCALAAVGWADGQLTAEAGDAIVRTALEEGLGLDEIAQIEEATKVPIDVGEIDRMNMTKADRLYVYAVASWITELDGPVSTRGTAALAILGDALGLPEGPREQADKIMREVASNEDRPDRFDLLSLRHTLDARLDMARQQRVENMLSGSEA